MKALMRALRWLWPPLGLGGAAAIYVHNMSGGPQQWYLPGIEYFTDGRRIEAATLSWQSLLAFGVFTLAYAIVMFVVERPEGGDIEEIGGKPQGLAIGKDVTFGDADLDRLVKWEQKPAPPAEDDDLVKFE